MRLLIIGDIYGKPGRRVLEKGLPALAKEYEPDFIVVNNENICHGFGPKKKHLDWLSGLGVDAFTGGNHSFRNSDDEVIKAYNDEGGRQIRPANYEADMPGYGYRIFTVCDRKVAIINLLGTVFMHDHVLNPFQYIDRLLGQDDIACTDEIIVDFHRETTSEGYAMAHHLDGRVSFLYGSHTHVQTNDASILPGGLGYITDIGMTGIQKSVIGVSWSSIQNRFLTGIQSGKKNPADGREGVISGVCVELSEGGTTEMDVIYETVYLS